MILVDCEQGGELWHALRLGVVTASAADKILTASCKPSAQAKGYMASLLSEWATGEAEPWNGTFWTERGRQLEPEAIALYEFHSGITPFRPGFVFRDETRSTGCSPDWLIGEDGIGEVKCPKAETHMTYMLEDTIPKAYIPQVQFQLWVTGRPWADFVSYFPGLPPVIVRERARENWQKALDEHVPKFVAELEGKKSKLAAQGVEPKAPERLRRAQEEVPF